MALVVDLPVIGEILEVLEKSGMFLEKRGGDEYGLSESDRTGKDMYRTVL